MPKITVVTCTCRDNPNLDRMANCLLSQTFTDFEWIIVDRKIRRRPFYYSRMIADIVKGAFPVHAIEPKWSIFNDFDLPAMSAARNSGIMWASGALVVWVDDNIWFKPDFLARHWAGHQQVYNGKPCYMVGLGWSVQDWRDMERVSAVEPFDTAGNFCKSGDWKTNNPQFETGNGKPCDDPRANMPYPWPDGSAPKMHGEYEVVTGAWGYGRNMSMPLEALLTINGNCEHLDGCPHPQDCEGCLRLDNMGMVALLDRKCCVYECTNADNKPMHNVLPFLWPHIKEVNGVKVTIGEFQIWAVMKTPSRIRANAHFDLRADRDKFRAETYHIEVK